MKDSLLKERYQVVECLSAGGSAFIYLARDKISRQMVVIKWLKQGQTLIEHKLLTSMFINEWTVLKQLNHERIPCVLDRGYVSKRAYMVMPYIQGVTLRDRLACQKINKGTLKKWLMCLLDILSYLHNQHFVHRDVTLNNVMCLPDETIKLIDFGIVAKQGAYVLPIGTKHYVSTAFKKTNLQQKQLLVRVDVQMDLYAVGQILLAISKQWPDFEKIANKCKKTAYLSALDVKADIASLPVYSR